MHLLSPEERAYARRAVLGIDPVCCLSRRIAIAEFLVSKELFAVLCCFEVQFIRGGQAQAIDIAE